jgi:hypothetical protein
MSLRLVVFVASLVAGSVAIVATAAVVGRGLLCLALIPALLVGFRMRRRASPVQYAAWLGVAAATVLVFGAHSGKLAWSNAANPNDWDMQIFALYGRSAAEGLNPYDAEDLRGVALLERHTDVFVADILRDGFPGQGEYTPPLLFLFAPFQWFDVHTGPWLWYLVNALVIGADVLLLCRLLLPGSGGAGLLLIAALVLAFRPTQATLALGQYNFLALLVALLYWRDRASVRGGLWLGVGAVVRSPLAILMLHPIRAYRWRTVAVALLTVLALWALATATFHLATVAGYFGTLGKTLPAWIYAESINQSLLGTALRLAGATSSPASPLLHPAYLAFAALLVVTIGLLWRLPREASWACGLTLPLALMIHPSVLEHYSVLLLFPLLVLWSRVVDGSLGRAMIVVLAIEYTLVGIGDGEWVFVATAFCWLWFAWLAIANVLVPTAEDGRLAGHDHG